MTGVVEFFLDQQCTFNQIAQQHQNLDDLRSLCDLKCMNKKNFKVFSHLYKAEPTGIMKFDFSVYPKDYEPLFFEHDVPEKNTSGHMAFFYGPCDPKLNFETTKSDTFYNICMGFFESEYDILKAIYEGFDSITIYTNRLDKYQIQYLAELGRDYHCNVVFMVHNKKEMEKVLETDATCLCVSGFHAETFKQNLSPIYQLPKRVPDGCLLFSFLKNCGEKEELILKDLKYKAIISI
jgi:hypothetical protein